MNQLCSIKGDVCSVASFWRTCEVRNFFMARYSFPSVTNSRSNKQCDPVLEQFRCTRLSVWYLPFSISYKQKVLCPARVVYWFLPLLRFFLRTFAVRDGLPFSLCTSLFIVPESTSRAKALVKAAICPWLILSESDVPTQVTSTTSYHDKPVNNRVRGGRILTAKFYCIDITVAKI